jgi:hypothetical protein
MHQSDSGPAGIVKKHGEAVSGEYRKRDIRLIGKHAVGLRERILARQSAPAAVFLFDIVDIIRVNLLATYQAAVINTYSVEETAAVI